MSDLPVGVPIHYFPEGYSVFDGGSCNDLPIAIAVGSEEKENYYYYLARIAAENCWGKRKSFFETRKDVLSDIGIEFSEYKADAFEDMLSYFITSIKNGIPILLPVTYSAMFYDLGYRLPVGDMGHAILLTGYREENGQIQIGDANMFSHGFHRQNAHYSFYETLIPTSYLKDIWDYSSKVFMEKDSSFYHKCFAIETAAFAEDNIQKRISSILNKYDSVNNKLAELIQTHSNKGVEDSIHVFVRRDLFGHMNPFFDYLAIQAEKKSLSMKDAVVKIKTEYLEKRNIIISRWHADSLKGTVVDEDVCERASAVIKMDEELFANFMSIFL